MSKETNKADILPVETPHFYVWISNGKELDKNGEPIIPEDQLPLPSNRKFNYLAVLRNECRKLKRTNTPAYLVYKGDLLTENQKQKMEDLAGDPEMDNLFVIDYDGDEFEKWCLIGSTDPTDKIFVEKMQESTSEFENRNGTPSIPKFTDSLGSIAHLIDLTKLFVVYRCDAVHGIVYEKYKNNHKKMDFLQSVHNSKGILYRDFDVTLKGEEAQPMNLVNGQISSTTVTNLLNKRIKQVDQLFKNENVKKILRFDMVESEDVKVKMLEYYDNLLRNPSGYVERYSAFHIPQTASDTRRIEIEGEFVRITHHVTSPKDHLIFASELKSSEEDKLSEFVRHLALNGKNVGIENSLIGVSGSRNSGIRREIKYVNNDTIYEIDQGEVDVLCTPYSVIQNAFMSDKRSADKEIHHEELSGYIAHCIKNTAMFDVGRDLSWKALSGDLHALVPFREIEDSPEKKTVLTVRFTSGGELKFHPAIEYYKGSSFKIEEVSKEQEEVVAKTTFDPNILPVTTPHFYVWISDGKKFESDHLVISHSGQFNYLETLRQECAKLAKTKTPAYLFYKGGILTEGQKQKIEDLTKEMPNLFVVDYDGDKFAQLCLSGSTDEADKIFVDKMNESTQVFVEKGGIGQGVKMDSIGTIANLIDLIKMFGVYRCDMMHAIAYEKYKDDPQKQDFLPSIQESRGILHRDFDVTLGANQMRPVNLLHGQISSTTRSGLASKKISQIETFIAKDCIMQFLKEAGVSTKKVIKDAKSYYEKLYGDPDALLGKTLPFINPETSSDEERQVIEDEFTRRTNYVTNLSEYPNFNEIMARLPEKVMRDAFIEIVSHKSGFLKNIIEDEHSLRIENSLLATSDSRHRGIGDAASSISGIEVCDESFAVKKGKEVTPFYATQKGLHQTIFDKDGIGVGNIRQYSRDCLREIEGELFDVGNDESWTKVEVAGVAQVGALPTLAPRASERRQLIANILGQSPDIPESRR